MEKFGLLALNGGGGGGLPPVTSADNGKVLSVVDGAWAASDNDFVVTFTKSNDTWSADKTTVNIDDAISAKRRIYGKVSASAVSNNSAFTGLSLLVPLNGDCGGLSGWQYGYSFGGSFQSGTSTIFVNFNIHTNPPSLTNSVTAYIKEIELAPAPLVVNYTIMGPPIGNTYLLSTATSYASIVAALTAGREVVAALTSGTLELRMRLVSMNSSPSTGYVAFSAVTEYIASPGALALYQITHSYNDDTIGLIAPLNTTVMQYNTTSGELSITNVPEVSS